MDEMEPLAYQNRFVRQLVQTMTDYEASDATPQIVSGPDNMIILQVSLEEWIQLTSSVFTGADICYPDISDSVRWILFRAVEQPVDLCALIAQCIENSPETRAAIRDLVMTDPEINQHIQGIVDAGQPLGPEIEGQTIIENDDLDALFGGITFLVDTIHDAIVDFNEDAEAANNSRELGQILFGAIPVIETLPFDEMSEYADTLFEQIIEVFNSQWDTTPITGSRDRIRCALFCAARDNDNSLTWDMVSQYFFERTSFTWSGTLNIMLDFANFVATGTWSGEAVVDIAFGNFAAAMSGMGKFGEMIFPSLTALLQLGQDTPDPDWEIVCEDCPPPPEVPNLSFSPTAGLAEFDGSPRVFIENTETGGSIWDLTFHTALGATAVAVTANNSLGATCVYILDVDGDVSYQHDLCAGGSDAGAVENPTVAYGPDLGWFGPSDGAVMRVRIETTI